MGMTPKEKSPFLVAPLGKLINWMSQLVMAVSIWSGMLRHRNDVDSRLSL